MQCEHEIQTDSKSMSRGSWIEKKCHKIETKGFKFWKNVSNLYPENLHVNVKMSKFDKRFSQKGRTAPHTGPNIHLIILPLFRQALLSWSSLPRTKSQDPL
jgi:hypothetical protein